MTSTSTVRGSARARTWCRQPPVDRVCGHLVGTLKAPAYRPKWTTTAHNHDAVPLRPRRRDDLVGPRHRLPRSGRPPRLPVKRALVVGGGGFIGSHLVRSLVDRGVDVVAVDLEPSPHPVPGARFEALDVRAPLPDDLTDDPPDTVYNFAAVHRVPGHED